MKKVTLTATGSYQNSSHYLSCTIPHKGWEGTGHALHTTNNTTRHQCIILHISWLVPLQ